MRKYIVLNKKVGETPLSVLENFKKNNPELRDQKLAYAGRLDPMASGLLLVLIGKECRNREEYLELDKEYIFEVLLGIQSDTGDILGLVEKYSEDKKFNNTEFSNISKELLGEQSFPYPAFSSKTVHGKPLFLWALENRLDEIEIPKKSSRIYTLNYLNSYPISNRDLHEKVLQKINSIPPVTSPSKKLGQDFRRKDIRDKWNKILSSEEDDGYQIVRFSCICSSGTYMRTLASEIARGLGTRGLALSIERTRIGKYKRIIKSLGFWYKSFSP